MILIWKEIVMSKGPYKIIEQHSVVGPFSFIIKQLTPGQKYSKNRLVIFLQAGILKAKQPPVKIYTKEYSKCGSAKRAAESILESILFDSQNAIEQIATASGDQLK